MFRTIQQVFFGSYGYFDMLVEIAVIWACVYLVFRFLKGTRGAGIVKGFAVLVVVVTLLIKVFGQNTDTLGRLNLWSAVCTPSSNEGYRFASSRASSQDIVRRGRSPSGRSCSETSISSSLL